MPASASPPCLPEKGPCACPLPGMSDARRTRPPRLGLQRRLCALCRTEARASRKTRETARNGQFCKPQNVEFWRFRMRHLVSSCRR